MTTTNTNTTTRKNNPAENPTPTPATIRAAVERLNAAAATMTGEQSAAALAALAIDTQAVNNANKAAAVEHFATVAAVDGTPAFWRAYLETGFYSRFSVRLDKAAQTYKVTESAAAVPFSAIDTAYKAATEKRLPVSGDFYRKSAHFAADVVRAMRGGLNDKTVSVGKLESAANALLAALIPAEVLTAKVYRADVRHLVHISDGRVKLDYESAAHDGHIKAANENKILAELLTVYNMRAHNGGYIVESKAITKDEKAARKEKAARELSNGKKTARK